MSATTKIARLLTGTLLVIANLVATFALLPRWSYRWGATEAEVARALPGDDLIERRPGDTTRAVTIDAPPEAVWPWIAQIGDDRGGFYSYTFIENPAQQAMMGGEPVYHNANRILSQFQDPQPGEGMIMDNLKVHAVEPGKWLLAAQTSAEGSYDWAWLWYLEPLPENQTRLLVRSAMRLPLEGGGAVLSSLLDAGAFIMEWRMIKGIELRAEGRTEPAGIEAIEIALWLAALVAGLGAVRLLLTRRAWPAPLLLGLAALLAVIWFTLWLPPVWLRLLVDVALFALVWWVARRFPRAVTAARRERRQTAAAKVAA